MKGGGKVKMHTGYVLLSNEAKGKRKLMCSEEDLTVIYHPLLCGDSLYLKAKTETAPKIACVGYPSVFVHSLRSIPSAPKHQSGRVIDIAAFQEKCQNCRALLRGCESFTSPSAAAYATGDPAAICGIILKALNTAPLQGPLTPFESPKRACCLLQEREAPVFPLGKSSSTSL